MRGGKFRAEIHGVFRAVFEFDDDLQIVRVQAEFFRLGHIASHPAGGGQPAQPVRGFLNGRRVDDALRAGGERPFVQSIADHLPRLAVLAECDLHHVALGKIPDAAFPKFPGRFGQSVEVFRRHRINKILIRTPDKDFIVLVRAERQLNNDTVGVTRRRTQSDLACRRRQPVSGQVRRGHNVLHKSRLNNAQTGEGLDE